MTHRATRVFLVVLAFAAAGTTGYLLWALDQREASTQAEARTFEATANRALLLVERFRAAQQSYVADGQGSEFWMKQVDEVLEHLERAAATLGGTATATELQDAARATASTIDDLRKMDVRSREWVRTGQGLMASDLIFTESLATSATLAEHLATLRDRHQQLAGVEAAGIRQQQLYLVSAAAATCLIVTLLLAPAVRHSTPQDTREALRALIGDAPPVTTPRAEPVRAVASAGGAPVMSATAGVAVPAASTAPAASVAPEETARQAPGVPRAPRTASVDVPAAARICSDLARVLDPSDLPRILADSASLLDARGLIVWVADRSGSSLFPTLSHGYAPAVLSRMGSIHRDDDNATAMAYRLSEGGVVSAKNGDAGAIVSPIVTPEGCVGVLAAEVNGGIENSADRRALAGILAAQLATLVTTLPAGGERIQAQG